MSALKTNKKKPRHSPENTEESISEPIDKNSIPSSPLQVY